MRRLTLTLVAVLFAVTLAVAQVRLPQIIADGMVLQREQPVKIWGWASPNEKVTVDFMKTQHATQANADGEWCVTLPAMKAGGEHQMKINNITLSNIVVGDVFVCSGQSNMELPIRRVMEMFAKEVNSYENTHIRQLYVPQTYNFNAPANDIPETAWRELTQQNVSDFSAVAYFFAKEYFQRTGVAVGIINTSLGGSPAQSWISEESLQGQFPLYYGELQMYKDDEYVEAIDRLNKRNYHTWDSALNRSDEGVKQSWYLNDTDDSTWQVVGLFDEEWKKPTENIPATGSYWLRKHINIGEKQASEDAVLYLGCIIDADEVFVNGVKVGNTTYQYPPRIYKVPASLLKEGENIITLRLMVDNRTAGFYEGKPYKLKFSQSEISLLDGWRLKRGAIMPSRPGEKFIRWQPTGLYNNMIAPLGQYSVCGVMWYQGESNTGKPKEYFSLMQSLIGDWRKLWGKNELPFVVIQLANYMAVKSQPAESSWAELRDQQLKVSQHLPNTGLAVIIDVGEAADIHPLDKKSVGERVSLQMQKLVLGDKKIVADSPSPLSAKVVGDEIIVYFVPSAGDLEPNSTLKEFAVAGEDGKFQWVEARSEKGRVIIDCKSVKNPRKVRYAWADNPSQANLRGESGLPASPFEVECK